MLLFRYAGDQTYFDEIKQFYYRDEFSHQVQEWNRQRTLAIERSLNQFLYPQMAKELKSKLIAEAKESIVRVISHHIDVIHSLIWCIIIKIIQTVKYYKLNTKSKSICCNFVGVFLFTWKKKNYHFLFPPFVLEVLLSPAV